MNCAVRVTSCLPGLQLLFLQALRNVRTLPSLAQARELRRISLRDMKGLRDFSPLESAPALEEFALMEASQNQPGDVAPLFRNPSMRRISASFGSSKKDREFERMRSESGLGPLDWSKPFQYRQCLAWMSPAPERQSPPGVGVGRSLGHPAAVGALPESHTRELLNEGR